MTDTDRADPDQLLAAIQKEEAESQRGKLKIFFGMSAGVGKTYAMLESAKQRKSEGIDVVIGYVETHHRAETEAMLSDLETVPRKKIEYHGTTIEEMDLDGILERKPQLVIVDELPHTNAPGSRHNKRYQDVLELLDAGMDVYTACNVQHLESRSDAVKEITGITVHETVPDSMIDEANDIELVDLTPEELLKRLAEGKVYLGDRAEHAANNFFRKGNLTALREMALRLTAERVDHQLRDYMTVKQIAGPWKASERLMVAVSPSPLSERLVRWTRRMAFSLEASWIAAYVEPAQPLSPENQVRLAHNLALARDLGGEVVSTSDTDIAKALIRLAHQRNVTQIVVGKPARNWFTEVVSGGSLVNRLVRDSGEIDVYVVTGDSEESTAKPLPITMPVIHSGLNQYGIALIVLGIVVGINLMIAPYIGYRPAGMILLLTILISANFLGRGPVFLMALLSALLWDFLFIPPVLTFSIGKTEDLLLVATYLLSALIAGNLTARLRSQEKVVRRREERMSLLASLGKELASAHSLDDLLGAVVRQMGKTFDADIAFLLADDTGSVSRQPHPASTLSVDEKDYGVASWVFQNSKPAGRFTDTLVITQTRYSPLRTPSGVVGVLGVRLHQADGQLSNEQETTLGTISSQIALVVERDMMNTTAKRAAVVQESEKLYSTLLDSISHELRTPLATIAGATSGLLDPNISSNAEARQALGEDLQEATERLNRLVDNLLDMTRLESGQLKLNREWCDVADLINISLQQVEKELTDHDVIREIDPNLPLLRVDFVLMEQVLVNLLHNAAIYTPPGTRIRAMAKRDGSDILLIVADRGPGLPPADLERIFDKFYRAAGAASGGTGLGLSICRGLVQAHGGTIIAENRANGGARFTIRLPIEEPPALPAEASVKEVQQKEPTA